MYPMTSRERVIAAISGQRPDRVPIDLNITLPAYRALKAYMGLQNKKDPAPNNAMEVIADPEVLSELGVDLISVKLGGRSALTTLPDTVKDSWGITRRLVCQSSGQYYEVVDHPLARATRDDLARYAWPAELPAEKTEALAQNARDLYEQTDLALVGRFGGPVLELAMDLLGMQEWYIRLGTDKEFVVELLERISAICTAHDLSGLDAAGKYLQIMKVSGEDFGMQTGPLYSPEMFNNILLPPLKQRWAEVRNKLDQINPQVKIMLHSCGAVSGFIPELIKAGIDILDPIQPLAVGMRPEDLKEKFGSSIVFHGGIDIQDLLPNGTPEQVADGTRQCLHGFQADQGGFIVAPSHSVQADVPIENIMAMVETAGKWPEKL